MDDAHYLLRRTPLRKSPLDARSGMAGRKNTSGGYDTRDQMVWASKYRKWVLQGAVWEGVRELFLGIAEHWSKKVLESSVQKGGVRY